MLDSESTQIYICLRLNNETNELVTERKKREVHLSLKLGPIPSLHLLARSKTYREVSAVSASKNPADSA